MYFYFEWFFRCSQYYPYVLAEVTYDLTAPPARAGYLVALLTPPHSDYRVEFPFAVGDRVRDGSDLAADVGEAHARLDVDASVDVASLRPERG